MVSFYLCFELFIENLFFKWVFSLQFIICKTNTIFSFIRDRSIIILRCFCSYRMVFCHFTCILHLYLLHLKPSINIFSTDYGIFNHQFLVFTIVLPWIEPSSYEYPHLEHIYCLLILILQLSLVQGNLFSYFSCQIEPHLVSFYKLPLYRTPLPYGVSLGPGLTP